MAHGTETPATAADCVRCWDTSCSKLFWGYVFFRWRQACFVCARWIDLCPCFPPPPRWPQLCQCEAVRAGTTALKKPGTLAAHCTVDMLWPVCLKFVRRVPGSNCTELPVPAPPFGIKTLGSNHVERLI